MEPFLLWLKNAELSVYLAIIVLFTILPLYRRFDIQERKIASLLVLFFIIDIISSIMACMNYENLIFYNLMLFPQLLMMRLVLVNHLSSSEFRRYLNITCYAIILLHAINLALFQDPSGLATYTFIPGYAWIAVASFFSLKSQLENIDIVPFHYLITWFSLATLIDFACSIPILSVLGWSNFLSQPYLNHLYDFNAWLYMLWYTIILTGILCTKTMLKSVLFYR
ncbi:MAG: hypothetical protein KBH11_11515 [Bacteroidia bacterium]|nr:hypothetical protein [Bacteroidia bacterium]